MFFFLDSFLFFLYRPSFIIFTTISSTTAPVLVISKSIIYQLPSSAGAARSHLQAPNECSDFHADVSELVSPKMKYLSPELIVSPSLPNSVGDSPASLAICINFLPLLWLKTVYSLTVLEVRSLESVSPG